MRTETLYVVNSLDAVRRLPLDVARLKGENLNDSEVLEITRLQSVKELSLSGCENVTDRSVAELSRVSTLETLDLSFCNQITSVSLKALAELHSLRSVNLNWCYSISDYGLIALARCRSLESISLWSCEEVTDIAVEALAKLPNLKILELPEFAAITDRALVALSVNAAMLESLRLDHLSEISDQGLRSLKTSARLRSLTINGCPKVTTNAVASIRRALPEMQIIHDSGESRRHS